MRTWSTEQRFLSYKCHAVAFNMQRGERSSAALRAAKEDSTGGCTSVLVWVGPWALGLLRPSAVTLSTSSESMLEAEAHAELTLERCDGVSCSLVPPTEPARRCWPPPNDPDEGRRSVAEEKEEDEEEVEEEEEEVWRAASSMLSDAFSSWEVMSAREMLLAAAGRAPVPLLPFTVLAGDARVLLLVLPVWG